MTHPRYILRDNTLMVTRRTLRRHHLFRPDPAIRQLYLYTLAVCARQCGVLVHAVTLMSTHEHLVVTDPEGQLPDFLHRLHRLVALGTKKLRKWEGSTWDHQRPSVVRLLTDQAIIEKLAYLMANPVKAGLVEIGRVSPCFPMSSAVALGASSVPTFSLIPRTRNGRRRSSYQSRFRQASSNLTSLTRFAGQSAKSCKIKKNSQRRTSGCADCGSWGPSVSDASLLIGVPSALNRSWGRTRPSRWGEVRSRCFSKPPSSFVGFVVLIDKLWRPGDPACEMSCSHRAHGTCAACTGQLSTRDASRCVKFSCVLAQAP